MIQPITLHSVAGQIGQIQKRRVKWLRQAVKFKFDMFSICYMFS